MSIAPARRCLAAIVVLLMLVAPAWAAEPQVDRPPALVPLYISFIGLQALDVHSTVTGVNDGAREGNPLVRGTLGNPAGLFVLKAGATAGVVFLTEKLWKRNRTAAVLAMVGVNSAYLTIAARNYRIGQRRTPGSP